MVGGLSMGLVRCMGCMEPYEDHFTVCPHCGYAAGSRAKEAYHLAPGTYLKGKYAVGRVLGYGGFGVTYIGYDEVMQRKVAIKEYLPGEFATRAAGTTSVSIYTGDKQEQFYNGITKFADEAKRLAQMDRVPGVVRIFDTFSENNTSYIVMEYLDGENLKQRLEREGKIPVEEAVKLMIPILEALTEVHAVGLLHRDISPDNIFITNTGEVKLLDFGAARFATTTHSRSLSVVVKQGFAPEEQYRSRGDQGTWTDVYACGATLYKMITGVTPEDAMERREKDELLPPSKMGVKIDKNTETAIMNAMNIRIEDRTQTTDQFRQELMAEGKVKKQKSHLKLTDIGTWPKWLKIASSSAAAAVLIFAVLIFTGVINNPFVPSRNKQDENEVYVPDVTNYSMDKAGAILTEYKLGYKIADKKNSDEIPEDLVMLQNFRAGQLVKVGDILELTISEGKIRFFLDDMTGKMKDEVVKDLKEKGFEVITKSEASPSLAPGAVIRVEYENGQDPEKGIEKGTKIIIWVSTGTNEYDVTKDTTVPDLVGKPLEEGQKAAAAAKLYIEQTGAEYSKDVPKGSIISQDPPKGTVTKEASKIHVVISLGTKQSRVPDLEYKSKEDAERLLREAGLKASFEYEYNDLVMKNRVIRQSVKKNTLVDPDTTITVVISNGSRNQDGSLTANAGTDQTGDTNERTPAGNANKSNNSGTNKGSDKNNKTNKDTNKNTKTDKTNAGSNGNTTGGNTSGGNTTTPSGGTSTTPSVAPSQDSQSGTPDLTPKYTITFYNDDGSVLEQKTLVNGEDYGTLPTPTKAYHTFEGWYTGKEGSGSKASSSTKAEAANVSYYPYWIQNGESGWVLAEDAPSDAEITATKWIYKEKQVQENGKELSGWTTESVSYGSWSNWGTSPISEGEGREVQSENRKEESVAHWHNYRHIGSGSYRYYYRNKVGGSDYYNSGTFSKGEWYSKADIAPGGWSAGEYQGYNGDSVYGKSHAGMVCFLDYWDYTIVTYYRARSVIYTLVRYVENESTTEVKSSGTISDVRKYVKYRDK